MLSLNLTASEAVAAVNKSKEDVTTGELPLSAEQPDLLRTGLGATAIPAVQLGPSPQQVRANMLKNVAASYGIGAAVRRQTDLKIVEQFHRLPGLRSSFLGLELEMGEDNEINFEDWLGDAYDNPRLHCDLHSTMQKHLGME